MKEHILMSNPDFENTFAELTSLEGIRYFYHVTNVNADNICEQGLFLQEKRLSSTTIEIPEEFKEDPITYCLQEKGDNYRKNPNIVLLGIPDEEVEFAVVKNYELPRFWEKEELPQYIIPAKYIIGYIDTTTFAININEYYEFINEHYL